MESTNANKENAAHAVQEEEPLPHQSLRTRGRTPSPLLKDRVIIYDCEERSLEVRSKKKFDKGRTTRPRQQCADHRFWVTDMGKAEYKKIDLPPRKNEITLFVDPETESKPTTENTTDGHTNVMLAKLYLDRLGTINQILRFLGQLSTLYVTNIGTWSETASRISAS
jgi:hypothetical protein